MGNRKLPQPFFELHTVGQLNRKIPQTFTELHTIDEPNRTLLKPFPELLNTIIGGLPQQFTIGGLNSKSKPFHEFLTIDARRRNHQQPFTYWFEY